MLLWLLGTLRNLPVPRRLHRLLRHLRLRRLCQPLRLCRLCQSLRLLERHMLWYVFDVNCFVICVSGVKCFLFTLSVSSCSSILCWWPWSCLSSFAARQLQPTSITACLWLPSLMVPISHSNCESPFHKDNPSKATLAQVILGFFKIFVSTFIV